MMQCKCGGATKQHDVTRNREAVAEYARCVACGFVSFTWIAQGWTREQIRETASADGK